ncbi:tripartite tricarboxylate transporter substrate binding protein [Halomonas sp. MCCC 1A11036]|uniref:Tripartite tricarboxylate transporter substrate binding protein n=2 Tax=Billgrantia zhangzhouensis TaxID=2733481 RepID=A0ABS9AFK5_9GAMM|nr:tripartite tricarboxylate transporter substrate binding protein [Halomonas zhangzhouensis]
MKTTIKKLVACASLAVGVAAISSAHAQNFPDGAVTIVVPFAAGTTTDQTARMLGEVMAEDLGQPVVIENRAGAGGSIGTQQVVQSNSDGYTLSMGTVGTLAINKAIYPDNPYDPEKDVTPIAFVGYTPTLLVVSGDSDFHSLDDLIAKAEDGGVIFASAGNGTSGHLAGELLNIQSDGSMIHVPFRSGAEGLTAVMSGEVDFMFYHPVAALPNIEAGTLRAIGVSGVAGSSVAPNVPPIAETFPDFDLVAWFLLAGPADMADDVTERLRVAVENSLASERVREYFERTGIEYGDVAPDNLRQFISDEVAKWGNIADSAQAQAD